MKIISCLFLLLISIIGTHLHAQVYRSSYGFDVLRVGFPSFGSGELTRLDYAYAPGLYIDVVEFQVSQATSIQVQTTASGFNPYLYLVSITNGLITNVWESTSASPTGSSATIEAILNPGTYWLGVASRNNTNSTGTYNTSISANGVSSETSLARALSANSIFKSPISPALSNFEALRLRSQDFNFYISGLRSQYYENLVRSVATRARISSNASFTVTQDFQLIPGIRFSGGIAGHEVVMLDGKYLDILFEYANYLVMRERNLTFDDGLLAINSIVANHNSYFGFRTYFTRYNGLFLNFSDQQYAESLFQSLIAFIVYHEYAHVYLNHAVESSRISSYVEYYQVNFSSTQEDAADFIAGVLIAKSGLSYNLANFGLDILHFYIDQRTGFRTSINQIPSDAFFDNPNDRYSTLINRHQSVAMGWRLYFQ